MQPHRAASWVYDVINVWLDALGMEVSLLSRGNLSWRFYNQELEFIRPAVSYLSRNGRHILRDLIAVKPAVASWIAEHDELRQQVESAATAVYHEGLMVPALRAAVAEARNSFLESSPGAILTGAYPAEKHLDLVIEHLINDIKELPAHQTDAEFWSTHRNRFAFFNVPSLGALRQVRNEFLKQDQAALHQLERVSFEICTEHGIPAAPSASVGY
jgi:hypothetical protein